jgi:hypothetical protein
MSHPANQPLSSDYVKRLSSESSTEGEDLESSSSSSFSSQEKIKGSLSLKSQQDPSPKSNRFTEKEEKRLSYPRLKMRVVFIISLKVQCQT